MKSRREYFREYMRKWRDKNRKKYRLYHKRWNKKNKEKCRKYSRRSKRKHADTVKLYNLIYSRIKRAKERGETYDPFDVFIPKKRGRKPKLKIKYQKVKWYSQYLRESKQRQKFFNEKL